MCLCVVCVCVCVCVCVHASFLHTRKPRVNHVDRCVVDVCVCCVCVRGHILTHQCAVYVYICVCVHIHNTPICENVYTHTTHRVPVHIFSYAHGNPDVCLSVRVCVCPKINQSLWSEC